MKTLLVVSKNPVKIKAALQGFQTMFPAETFVTRSVSVSSGVSDQPMSSAETLQGAMNRVHAARPFAVDSEVIVGIEGGIEILEGEMHAFAWVVIQSGSQISKSRTGTFILPPKVAGLVQQGIELGEADDIVFGRSNSKQENGAIGLLTDNVIDRTTYYQHAVILALVQLKHPELYPEQPR